MATLRDRLTLGALAGIGAILTRDVYSFFAKQVGFSKFYVWNIAADLFLKDKEVYTALGTIIGILADLGMGALLGVFFIYLLRWTGEANPIIKGAGVGIGSWLFFFGIMFHTLPHTAQTAPLDAMSNFSAFVGHTIFGLSLGLIGSKLLGVLRDD